MRRALPFLWWLGCATATPVAIGPLDEAPVVTVGRLDNGARVVTAAHGAGGFEAGAYEIGLFVRLDPEIEPLGLEGASGLLADLAIERAGDVGEASPHARALTLGGRLEAYTDGALVGWRLSLGACGECPGRLERAWALLLDVALAPDLRASTVTRRAEQYRDRLLARVDGLSAAARRWAIALAAGYGRPVGAAPTERAAGAIHREAMVRLHRALVTPARMVAVGPMEPVARARLAAASEAGAKKTVCGAPAQVTFGLGATGPASQVVARRAPGRGMMGRRELEAALAAARAEPALRERRVELVDVGTVAVLVDEGQGAVGDAGDTGDTIEAWLERAAGLVSARSERPLLRRSAAELAEDALSGVAPAGSLTLGPPITVWYGDPSRFPTLPVMLTRDTPRCRP